MRVLAVCLAALLLSSCAWVRHEIAPATMPPVVSPAKARDRQASTGRPEPAASNAGYAPTPPVAAPAPPPDYSARCRAMADNRADDAKQLGASAADQAKVQSDTYRDCMAQSVKLKG